MRRPAGVVAAAIVLGLIALFGIFAEVLILGVTLFVAGPVIPHMAAGRATLAAVNAVALCFFLFCEWTVVGLFRMRRWARIAMLIVAGVVFCFSAILCVGMAVVRVPALPVTKGPSPVSLHEVFLGMAVVYGLLSLIGAWWLVYFNLKPVRAAFAPAGPQPVEGRAEPAGSTAWRVVIMVWAWLLLLGALVYPLAIWARVPLFLFGVVVRGTDAMAVLLGMMLVQVVLGVGLLRKWKAAWYVGVASLAYWVLHVLSFMLPGSWARFTAYQQEVAGRWGVTVTSPGETRYFGAASFMWLGLVVGMAAVVVLTWALIQQRRDFLGGNPGRFDTQRSES